MGRAGREIIAGEHITEDEGVDVGAVRGQEHQRVAAVEITQGVEAAGYMRKISADPDNLTCASFCEKRLIENYRNKLRAEQAIQHWIGWPE
ncbi:hypothetical protein, partial [Nocardia cyriacigeorgica]|uniref:hypothetical protein n=1 Tax=Nocardia cyriacigeorgica TaxID=135487 RepID=UPI002453C917